MSEATKVTMSEREIFLAALEKKDDAQRGAFLESACGGNPGLRRRIEELLREHTQVGDFLEAPALAGGAAGDSTVVEKPGDRIGRYKLLQKIGEGGVGVVYMAEQEEPVRRRVALKVIKLGMDTRSVIARFEAERQALAMMDHPNIARVLDAGATETGRPYFVMELVRGIKITEYCDQNQLTTAERLRLFIQVCQAIQHAHQKGIIHRDIKPSNILVTLHDGIPVPKVIDFGIAKATEARLTDKTLFTEFSTFIGTPAYMSPEQTEISGLDIDTRSDIYSLGVLLYELLTGSPPFDPETLSRMGLDECRRTIREKEPPRPSTRVATLVGAELTTTATRRHTEPPRLIHQLRGDLDWIVMRCLEKDRTRRYASASELAEDIRRYLEGDPVLARPPSNLYRLQKFVRRHQTMIGAAAAVALALCAGVALSAWQAVRAVRAERAAQAAQREEARLRQQAEHERLRAEQGEASARLNEYIADVNLAQQSLAAGNLGRAVQLLNKHLPRAGQQDLRGFEWRYLWQLCQGDEHQALPTQDETVQTLAMSPGGELLAVGMPMKVHILNLRTHSVVASLPNGASSMTFLPSGRHLVTTSMRTVRIWSTSTWREERALPETSGPLGCSADGTRLASVSFDGVRVWDTATWRELRHLDQAWGPVALSPDGGTLVADGPAGLTLWPLREAGPERVLPDSTNLFARGGPWFRNDRVLAFTPDGRSVIAARNTLSERGVFVLSLWDIATGRETVLPDDPGHVEHSGVISGLAFSPDGQTLATASMDYSIRLWNLARRQRITTLQGHLAEVRTVAFTPDGEALVSGAKDGSLKLWPLRRAQKDDILEGHWLPLAFSKDGRRLAALTQDDSLAYINAATGVVEERVSVGLRRPRPGPSRGGPPPGKGLSLAADLRTMAQAQEDGTVRLWRTDTQETNFLKVAEGPVEVTLSPDGRSLLTAGRFQGLRLWDLRSGASGVIETEARRAFYSPDSRLLVGLGREGVIEVWDVATRVLLTNLVNEAQHGFGAPPAFSPDSRVLAVVCFDDTVRLWELPTGRFLGTCAGHKQGVTSVAFSADGMTLATASEDSTLKMWNVATQQELLSVRRLGGALRALLFSPDGRLLVGTTWSPSGGALRFHRAPLFSEIKPLAAGAH